ncbi:MAG: 7-cyano-7-deazaguanine synthase QueC [Desulfobacteraceae bacterium]|nr:7-cyano-7-deazaguanine synthase QueC [Desulfobacteraceae bacterium]
MPNAVVLLSGGLDSSTVTAIAHHEGYKIYCLSFNYDQRNVAELKAAKRIASLFKVEQHYIIDIGLGKIGGSALTDDIQVPKNQNIDHPQKNEIPITYVPARNTIFLSYALAWAEVLMADTIFIGVNVMDYSGYPDCRQEYINAFENMANLATKAGVTGDTTIKIKTPLINLTKAQIIKKGTSLNVDYSLTLSCYDPDSEGRACGACDSCLQRKKGFQEAGVKDPTLYQ